MSFTAITSFHFGKPTDGPSPQYDRLIRGLRSTVCQLGSSDRLILVASGSVAQGLSVDQLFADVGKEPKNLAVIASEAGNVQSGNAGFKHAVDHPLDGDEWICSIQSSVVIASDWFLGIRRAVEKGTDAIGLFGQLLVEENPDLIWADGHCLHEGKTYNEGYCKPRSSPLTPCSRAFPCLSAAAYRSSSLKQVIARYGEAISTRIDRYGDCTDLALRLISLDIGKFCFVKCAIGYKRWPLIDRGQAEASQLIAAGTYYESTANRLGQARDRLRGSTSFARASAIATAGLIKPYGQDGLPSGSALDDAWT